MGHNRFDPYVGGSSYQLFSYQLSSYQLITVLRLELMVQILRRKTGSAQREKEENNIGNIS
jgi:hypothetical protein